jgi:membrane protease YdiL (CAAX protease family)
MNPLGEVCVATAFVALWLFATERLAGVPWLAPHVGALVAAGFLAVPLVIARYRRLPGDVLALDGPLRPALRLGLWASLLVLPVFAAGHDVWVTRVLHTPRGGPGLASPGLGYQEAGLGWTGRVVLAEEVGAVAATNRTPATVLVRSGVGSRAVAPGGRLLLTGPDRSHIEVVDAAGRAVAVVAADGESLAQPIDASPGFGWLGWLLAGQLLVVALPEEAFFRGYVLSRLRAVWPPRRRLWGVPFGRAHVLSAALFALVHLVVVPHPARLMVFFPALVFAWLGERSRGALAPAVHHALCNVVLRVLQRCYG